MKEDNRIGFGLGGDQHYEQDDGKNEFSNYIVEEEDLPNKNAKSLSIPYERSTYINKKASTL